MKFDNIVDICVAIDTAILGIAYPIIVDKISGIGEKYNSNYLSNLFNSEFPQRHVKFKWWFINLDISYFKLLLYLTILSFLPLIVNVEPPFGWDNSFVNNSADIILLLMTAYLTICFFRWLDIVVQYNGKATSLLQYLINRYHAKERSEEDYHLKTVNEFALYAIDRQDEHLQNTLLEFYYVVFSNIRQKHDRKKPLIYPVDLYEMVYRLCYKLVNIDNKQLLALEHRAVSGSWFLGEDFEEIEISKETYSWLWRILNTIVEKDKFIRMYWSTAHQYYDMKLPYIVAEYDRAEHFKIINEEKISERIAEKEKFLEFNFGLGGLLLYRQQYKTLKYIFQYTQSQPPSYVLLPENMTTIFKWFELFSNEYKHLGEPIDLKYYFFGLDNLGSRRDVGYWMCSYMALLYIRLYSLHQNYIYQDHTGQPNLPNKIHELRDWLRAVPYFERCLNQLLENKELLKELGYEKIAEDKRDTFSAYLEQLKQDLNQKIEQQHHDAEISEEKRTKFYQSSVKIISDAFTEYKKIANLEEYINNDNDLKLTVKGQTNLSSKSSFIDDTGVAHLNYDTFLAEGIASHSIRRYIPNSFLVAKTRRYLLNRDNIIDGLKKLIGNKKDVVIVGINLDYDSKPILEPLKDQLLEINGGEYNLSDVLFVLDKKDLPFFQHRELEAETVEKERFELIDDRLKVYVSILDLSKDENAFAKEKWTADDIEDEIKVQVTIAFLTLIIYKNDREIVQVNIASRYREQGIQNSLNDIEPLKQEID